VPAETHPAAYALTKYWDVALLKWVKGTQPAGGGGGGGPVTVADGADVVSGSTTDAAVTTNANGTISAKLRGLVVWFTRLAQLNNTIPNPSYSLQIGGANTDGGTHRHVGASNAEPASGDVGLFVRNITGMGAPGSAAPNLQHVIAGRDPNTNAVRQVEVLPSAPAGTEGGVITRNIPSGTQPISAASLPLPTGAALDASVLLSLTTIAFQARINTLGQKTMANSTPMVIASDQASIPVAATLAAETVKVIGTINISAGQAVTANAGTNLNTSALSLEATQLLVKAKTDNLDVALSTRWGTLGQKTMAGSAPVVIASDQPAFPVTIAAAVNPSTYFGKTITYVPVNQGAAGATTLAAADATKKHKVIGAILTMSVAGTLKFSDGVADMLGPCDIGTTGGFVAPTSIIPYTETGAINRALTLTTTLGAARGVVIILTE
jgi:hypothetical protein